MIEAIVLTLIVLLFLGLGLYLIQGKGGFLIAGYNTMSKEEQAQYDEEAMCKFIGKNMLILAGSMLFYVFGALYDSNPLFIIGTVIMVIICIYMIVRLNTGDRFKKKDIN